MAALQRIFYVSRVANGGEPIDVRHILGRSRMRNRQLDVTGMLTFSGRHFAQVLEGTTEAIDELVADVAADSRHADFRLVFRKPIVKREYSDWDMGYIEGFGAAERIEQLLDCKDAELDVAEAERFAARLFAPAF